MELGAITHTLLHIITVVISLGLFILAFIVYRRHKGTKFLVVLAAFLIFAIKESLLAIQGVGHAEGGVVLYNHILDFVVVLLLAYAILRR